MRRMMMATAAVLALAVPAAAQQQQPPAATQQQTQDQAGQQDEAGLEVGPATIREIQQSLRELGHDPGPVDGLWGPRTSAAVSEFQRAQGLDETGRLNLATIDAMGFDRMQFAGAGAVSAAQTEPVPPQVLGTQATRLVQQRLNRRSKDINTDGVWGPETETALRLLQMSRDLPVTGRLDQATLEELGLNNQQLAEADAPEPVDGTQ